MQTGRRLIGRRLIEKSALGFALLALLLIVQPTQGYDIVRNEAAVIADEGVLRGEAEFWKTRLNFLREINLSETGWLFVDVQSYLGLDTPTTKKGKPVPGKFPCKPVFDATQSTVMIHCSITDEMLSSSDELTRYVAIHGDVVRKDPVSGDIAEATDFWVYYEPTAIPFEGLNWGWYFATDLFVPEHF